MEKNTNTSTEDMKNSDTSEVKPCSLKAILDSGKPSSSSSAVVNPPGSPIKKETPDSCEEVADGGNDSVFASESYLKYDKDEPELKGPITSHPQFEEYQQQFQDIINFHSSLVKILEGYSDEFKKLAVDQEDALARGDMHGYNEIVEQIKETGRRKSVTQEKLMKVLLVLHAEMASITQRMLEYAEALVKAWKST